MTAIREATGEDVPAIVTMAQHFVSDTAYGACVPSDAGHLQRVTEQLLALGVIFVAERDGALIGMLAGLAYPHFLTTKQTASETALWVEWRFRGARIAKDLIEAFERWAAAQHATRVELGSWHAALDTFYGRLGYTAAERVFYKELAS